ncbi:MAG: hypothetical protein WDW38_008914 [Sanguina aurantia]
MEEDFDREIKVVVIGNGGVGKTSMIKRFGKGVFTDDYKKTIGVDFLEKSQYIDALQDEVKFYLWDTAGQEEFDALTRTYYRGAGAAVLAFSTTDRPSFDAVATWKAKVEAECGEIAMCLVQNKVDLLDQAVADAEEVEALARKLGLKLYRTCVKQNVNVAEVFAYLAELHQRKLVSGTLNQPTAGQREAEQAASQKQQQQEPQSTGNAFQPTPSGGAGRQGSTEGGADAGSEEGAAGGSAKGGGEVRQTASTVVLGPSKMRTKGKKKWSEKLTCSIA